MMRRLIAQFAVIAVGCCSVSAFAANAPMQPGLWSMQISGMTKVSSPPIRTPMNRTTQICIKAHQKPAPLFLPSGSEHCTSSHKALSNGKTQWTFLCQTPGTLIKQVGWFQTDAHHFNSHWTTTDTIHVGTGYTAVTTMQIKGKHLSDHCGTVK